MPRYLQQALEKYQTPFYIFNSEDINNRITLLKSVFPSNVKLCYAMKANPFVIKEMEEMIDFYEVCSPGELRICEKKAIEKEKIVLSGVYKSPQEIETTIRIYGDQITYTAESLTQLDCLQQFAEKYHVVLDVLPRLTTGNQFGIDKNELINLFEQHTNYPSVNLIGLQFFSGTQKKVIDKHQKELALLDTIIKEIEQVYKKPLQKIEYGAGLGVSYFENEVPVNAYETAATLGKLLGNMSFKGEIVIELGRFLAANCGSYVTTVVDKKINDGYNYCIVDGGIHQITYFGQMMGMKKPFIQQVAIDSKKRVEEDWTICGALCTNNDVLVKNFPLQDLSLGDKLIFKKAGAYCFYEGMALFLSRDLPQIIIYSEKNGCQRVRKRVETEFLNDANYNYSE